MTDAELDRLEGLVREFQSIDWPNVPVGCDDVLALIAAARERGRLRAALADLMPFVPDADVLASEDCRAAYAAATAALESRP